MNKTKYLTIIILATIIWACSSKPEPNLELSNPEAFSFDLGDGWEVNASVSAKGFGQKEEGDNFSVSLSYSVDLITANSDTMVAVYNETVDETDTEEFMDFILEAQIEIESTFSSGDYKLIFNVKDNLSGQEKSLAVDFNLVK